MTCPGHSSIGGSPRWAYCAISGGSLSRYQSLRASRRRFPRRGWLEDPGDGPPPGGLGADLGRDLQPEACRCETPEPGDRIRLRPPRPPPWAGGEIAANLECLLYYIAVFLLSTHIAGSSCARLMRPGPRWFVPSFSTHPRDARARPPAPPRSARERVPLVVTQALAVACSAGRVSSCTSGRALHSAIAAAGPLDQRGCAESRRPRLRLIISEIGGCIIDLPPDTEEIERSLRKYASLQGDQDGKSTKRHGMNNSVIMAKGGKGGSGKGGGGKGGSGKGGGGNNPNFPSGTGNPSGGGRGNNPPKK